MPLFRDHPYRSAIGVAAAISAGYALTSFMSSSDALQMTQTTVAILAIAGLMLFITLHHQREGQIMTQTQEEVSLIVGLGLFCMVGLIAWRSVSGDVDSRDDLGFGSSKMARVSHKGAEDYYYVVEDYTYKW